MTTTVTVTQSTRTNPIITSVMWPTTKSTKVPPSIYNVPSARIQETPNSPLPKLQGRDRTPVPVHKIFLMEYQPVTLIPKTRATATPAILAAMSTPSSHPTPLPNTVMASTNLFITRSWSLPPNKGDSLIPAMQKMIESDPSKTENTSRKTTIPCPFSLISENIATASSPATANIVETSKSQEERWGPLCQCCVQSASHPEQADLDWSEEDWDREIQKVKLKENKDKQKN